MNRDNRQLWVRSLCALTTVLSLGACSKVGFGPDSTTVGSQSIPTVQSPPVLQFPSVSNVAAVAFEDNYPNTGDADYNDFMMDFRVLEKINTSNQITDIIVDFYPRAVGGSYDHSLLFVLNGVKEQPSNISLKTSPLFQGGANVKLTHYDANGVVLDVQDQLPVDKDVTVFSSTHGAFSVAKATTIINTISSVALTQATQRARLEIKLSNPSLNPVNRADIDAAKLRMILHVKNTNKDIDLVDVDPSNFDSNGYPFGFIIPSNWQWPQEGVSITGQYPYFSAYQSYLLAKAQNPLIQVSAQVLNWFNTTSTPSQLFPIVPMPVLLPDP